MWLCSNSVHTYKMLVCEYDTFKNNIHLEGIAAYKDIHMINGQLPDQQSGQQPYHIKMVILQECKYRNKFLRNSFISKKYCAFINAYYVCQSPIKNKQSYPFWYIHRDTSHKSFFISFLMVYIMSFVLLRWFGYCSLLKVVTIKKKN